MSFKEVRDWLQQTIYKIIGPTVHGMIKVGITPNVVTTTGLVLNIVAAAVLVYGGFYGEDGDFSYVGWGGLIILFAGLFDMMDGQVARIGDMKSTFGALYDSVRPLQRIDYFLRHLLLFELAPLFLGFDYRFHRPDWFLDGQLRPRSCRGIGD